MDKSSPCWLCMIKGGGAYRPVSSLISVGFPNLKQGIYVNVMKIWRSWNRPSLVIFFSKLDDWKDVKHHKCRFSTMCLSPYANFALSNS